MKRGDGERELVIMWRMLAVEPDITTKYDRRNRIIAFCFHVALVGSLVGRGGGYDSSSFFHSFISYTLYSVRHPFLFLSTMYGCIVFSDVALISSRRHRMSIRANRSC